MFRSVFITLLLLPFSTFAELEFESARIKHLPASVPVRAGYVSFHNPGDSAVTIVRAHSNDFGHVEFHESLMVDGMMQMKPVDSLTIPAGGNVHLKPGGLHMMLMQPAKPTTPGETYDLQLEFEDGSRQQLTLTVTEE